jgi:hypothetical protein
MIRTQVQLTPRQAAAMRRLAKARGVSLAACIRDSVDCWLVQQESALSPERVARAKAVAGRFSSGLPDLGEHHDRYLDEAGPS